MTMFAAFWSVAFPVGHQRFCCHHPLSGASGSRGGGQIHSRGRQDAEHLTVTALFQLKLKFSHLSLARAAVFGLHRHGAAP